jgi:hypothetical protein
VPQPTSRTLSPRSADMGREHCGRDGTHARVPPVARLEAYPARLVFTAAATRSICSSVMATPQGR